MAPWEATWSLFFEPKSCSNIGYLDGTASLVFSFCYQTWLCKYGTDRSCVLHSTMPTCSGDCARWSPQSLNRTILTTGGKIAVNSLPFVAWLCLENEALSSWGALYKLTFYVLCLFDISLKIKQLLLALYLSLVNLQRALFFLFLIDKA